MKTITILILALALCTDAQWIEYGDTLYHEHPEQYKLIQDLDSIMVLQNRIDSLSLRIKELEKLLQEEQKRNLWSPWRDLHPYYYPHDGQIMRPLGDSLHIDTIETKIILCK